MSGLGVIIPTRNSAAALPRHLEHLRSWIDLADQVVVVDSESTDATLSLLREGVNHPRLRLLQHPPGLYPSWNFGFRSLGTRWAYVSTIGDTITREHLQHLLETATALDCDVLCSPPQMLHADGSPAADATPAEIIRDDLALTAPANLTPAMIVGYAARFALAHGLNTPLGSSASNLYRTAVMQQRPFPTSYGSAGDAFWLLENAAQIRYGLTPRIGSTYLLHPTQHAKVTPQRADELHAAAARLTRESIVRLKQQNAIPLRTAALLEQLCTAGLGLRAAQRTLEELRQRPLGKLFAAGPAGWRARSERQRRRRELAAIESQLLNSLTDACGNG